MVVGRERGVHTQAGRSMEEAYVFLSYNVDLSIIWNI